MRRSVTCRELFDTWRLGASCKAALRKMHCIVRQWVGKTHCLLRQCLGKMHHFVRHMLAENAPFGAPHAWEKTQRTMRHCLPKSCISYRPFCCLVAHFLSLSITSACSSFSSYRVDIC
ncbi:hypothetical protein VNO77_19600 [Canavalia gladiata]|uniref:Uncharacterized protein n=1 Tax=Canavalia gladiata TaxID=3824 RepID=A0AAN9LNP7_CANGL